MSPSIAKASQRVVQTVWSFTYSS